MSDLGEAVSWVAIACIASFALGWMACSLIAWPLRISRAYNAGAAARDEVWRLALDEKRARALAQNEHPPLQQRTGVQGE